MKKKIIVVIAVLLLVLPLGEWLYSILKDVAQLGQAEGATLPLIMIMVYYPARLFALLGFTFMFYQFVLSAKLPAMEALYKRAELIKRHRSLGILGFALMLVHGLFMLLFDLLEQGALSFTLEKMLGISALFLLVIGVVAAWQAKALNFKLKTWKQFHLALYVVLPLAFIHAITIGTVAGNFGPTQLLYSSYLLLYCYLAIRKLRAYLKDKRAAEIKAVAAEMIAASQKNAGEQK